MPHENPSQTAQTAGTATLEAVGTVALLHDQLAALADTAPSAGTDRRLADTMLRAAIGHVASDIHIDPLESGVIIRFRINGRLLDAASLRWDDAHRLINQIKTLAGIDPTAVFTPEDARWTHDVGEDKVDIRVSIAPCLRGPKLALRLLDRSRIELPLDQLGLEASDLVILRDWLQGGAGMLICAGPTGSGKTTTLYALLRELAHPARHIITVEDPPEYQLDGINQIAIDPRHGIDFPTAIRAVLRLDPDRVMLGEIRDPVTAHTAVEAAQAGRTVLTSLHASDTVATIAQLRNWQLDDHSLAATLGLTIAQRRVPVLCQQCREETKLDPSQQRWLSSHGLAEPTQTFTTRGCHHCAGTGVTGCRGLFELWLASGDERDAIRCGIDSKDLRRLLQRRQHRGLVSQGLAAVNAGEIALDHLRGCALPISSSHQE
ncbi:MAG: ATPase, T2SS/T4P/T4SS family [Planctomycetota bacterium]|jgi:general secretion pathway protein E|nr:ATPase, T2SS/T4P/T4SS family [Planctomycetota bacterium]